LVKIVIEIVYFEYKTNIKTKNVGLLKYKIYFNTYTISRNFFNV